MASDLFIAYFYDISDRRRQHFSLTMAYFFDIPYDTMTQPTPEYQRQRRLPARLARCQTQLERHCIETGETLLELARRLNLNHSTVYRLAGRGGSYTKNRKSAGFAMDSNLIEVVSRDTGIPIGQLYEEAAMAARKRSENGKDHGY